MPDENRDMTATEAGELLKRMKAIASDLWREPPEDVLPEAKTPEAPPARPVVRRMQIGIDNLWMTADETIEWTEALSHAESPDGLTDRKLWSFYHEKAAEVLSGDPTAYAEVLRKANPLGELTGFAQGISMRVPDSDRVEVTFETREEYMQSHGKKYLSAMGVRMARDLLACLPVSVVRVTAASGGKTAMQADYRRELLSHRNFSYLDPVALTEACGARFEAD